MRTIYILFVLITGTLLQIKAAAFPLQNQNRETSELTVFVTDTNGVGIPDAQIYIEDWGYYYTDYDGYAYIVLDNGTYSLQVSHFNYYPDSATINLTADTTLVFSLVRLPEVTFHISDTTGTPVQGASIEINWYYYNYTDENGNATFYLDTSNAYFATISHDFYYPDTVYFQVQADTTINISLVPKPVVEFYVKDTNDNPISYAYIEINAMSYETDYEGYVKIPLDTGSYSAIVSANGYFSKLVDFTFTGDTTIIVRLIKYPTLTMYVRDTADNPLPYGDVEIDWDYYSTDENGILTVNLEPGDHQAVVHYYGYYSDTINFTLTNDTTIIVHLVPLPMLTIHVTDENGTPLENSYAEIDYEYYYADSNGDIKANLYPGSYQAYIYEDFHKSDTIDFYFSHDTTIYVVLQSLPVVTFHISDTSGNPVEYPDIVVDGYWYSGDEQGIARIGLLQGEHYAEIYAYGYQEKTFNFTVNQDTDIYVQLIPYPEVTFKVTDTAGNPLPYAFVDVYGGTNNYTDSNGLCVVKVPPSQFEAYVSKSAYYDVTVYANYAPDTVITVELTPISLAVFHVTNTQGKPIAGAQIYIEYFGDIIKTDSSGTAQMAMYSGYYTAITEYNCYSPDTTDFETYEGEQTEVDIILEGGDIYTVTFNVKDENNNAVSNALIIVNNDTLITDNQGVAEIDLWCSEYNYKVITSCGVYTGTFSVQGNDVNVMVEINCTGEKSLQATDIFAYPNPVRDILHIINKRGSELIITDINGKILLKTTVISDNYELNMTTYRPGIYLIRLEQPDKTEFAKIIKR